MREHLLTSTVFIIPTPPMTDPEEYGPLRMIAGKSVLKHTYDAAESIKRGKVIVATPTREVAQYCSQRQIFWRPVKADCDTSVDCCRQVVAQFRAWFKVTSVVCWPWFRPIMDANLLKEIVIYAQDRTDAHTAQDEDGFEIFSVYPIKSFNKQRLVRRVNTYKTNLLPAITDSNLSIIERQLECLSE